MASVGRPPVLRGVQAFASKGRAPAGSSRAALAFPPRSVFHASVLTRLRSARLLSAGARPGSFSPEKADLRAFQAHQSTRRGCQCGRLRGASRGEAFSPVAFSCTDSGSPV